MLFVAKFAKYRALISAGSTSWVRDREGYDRQIDNGDIFWADFVTGGLDVHDRELAIQEFRRINGNEAFGAEPVPIDGSIDPRESSIEGNTSNVFEGYSTYQRLSRFDTDDGRQCPERWRERTEEVLLSHSDVGRDFIRLDILVLAAPWPTYDTMAPEEIVPFAVAGGYDLQHVLKYERATKKRPEVGKPLAVALKERDARMQEQAALTVTA